MRPEFGIVFPPSERGANSIHKIAALIHKVAVFIDKVAVFIHKVAD